MARLSRAPTQSRPSSMIHYSTASPQSQLRSVSASSVEPLSDSSSSSPSSEEHPTASIPNFYRTSISSYPPSTASSTDDDQPNTPTRPAHRFTPRHRSHLRSSPRRSTPRRTPDFRSSPITTPKPRREPATASDSDTAVSSSAARHPLVLLHVSLLPGADAEHAALLGLDAETRDTEVQSGPRGVVAQLTSARERQLLLRARLTPEVAARGVLVPHPGPDLEVLLERVLVALGLWTGRVGDDGHFLGGGGCLDGGKIRNESDDEGRVDSGAETDVTVGGDKISGEEEAPRCETCRSKIVASSVEHGVRGEREWDVQVFAANGLMKPATWGMAWAEMERVDVVVAPWLSLEARGWLIEHQRVKEQLRHEGVDKSRAESVEIPEREDMALLIDRLAELESDLAALKTQGANSPDQIEKPTLPVESDGEKGCDATPLEPPTDSTIYLTDQETALPPAFYPEQIPLEVLLRNCLLVLISDVRNVIIFGLLMFVVVLGIQVSLAAPRGGIEGATYEGACDALRKTMRDAFVDLARESAQLKQPAVIEEFGIVPVMAGVVIDSVAIV